MNQTERMINRIDTIEKFRDIAELCEDFQSFVDEVQEWGVDHICGVDFDGLSDEAIKELDTFIASFGCSPSDPHPCSKYATPIYA